MIVFVVIGGELMNTIVFAEGRRETGRTFTEWIGLIPAIT